MRNQEKIDERPKFIMIVIHLVLNDKSDIIYKPIAPMNTNNYEKV